MAGRDLNVGRLAARFRDYQLTLRHLATGPGFWIFLAALVVWSAVNPGTRDLFVVGIVVGSILTLGALGLTLIYGILKFGNFAHGDMMMMSAYIAFFVLTGRIIGERTDTEAIPASLGDLPAALDRIGDLTFGYGLILATVVAALVMGGLSVGLDRLVYRPLRRRRAGIVILAVASLGIALATRSAILIFWGPDPRQYVSGVHPAKSLPFDVSLKTDQIFTLIAALVLTALVYALLYRSKLGKAMRAVADNAELARVSGINTEGVIVWTWFIGGALMAVAGVLLANQSQLNPQLGFVILLPLFASVILGGVGSPLGALAGAMVVGIATEVSVEYFAPGYKPGVAFVILVSILLLRPRGMFGATA